MIYMNVCRNKKQGKEGATALREALGKLSILRSFSKKGDIQISMLPCITITMQDDGISI